MWTLRGKLHLLLLERKDPSPVILHANYRPTALPCLVVELLGKGTHLCVGQSLRWTIFVFTLGVVVKYQHRQPRPGSGPGIFQHLSVAGRIAERCERATTD